MAEDEKFESNPKNLAKGRKRPVEVDIPENHFRQSALKKNSNKQVYPV